MALRLLSIFAIALLFLPLFVSASACPTLSRTLARGARGADVVSLQKFLIAEKVLEAGNDSGYFGKLTEAAVQKWQAAHGVVSSGTPATTGYGVVGGKTRAAIKTSCGAATSSAPIPPGQIPMTFDPPAQTKQPTELAQCPVVALPIGQPCAGTWREQKDAQGKCTASWQCMAN